MPILVDFSQIACAGIFPFQRDLKTGSDAKITDLIRHVILSSLLYNKRKFGREYGELIICTDATDYWRKEEFPNYKANRAAARAGSDLDWKLLFSIIRHLGDDLKEHFPYKVMKVDRAEADDIIGVVTKYLQTNDLVQVGLDEEPQKILILSADQDNFQLQTYRNVKQWSPKGKKYIKPENGPVKALIEKICTGDSGDGVPNILSPDDVFVDASKRQSPFATKRLEEFYKHGIDACKNDTERRNYHRNELLVSYDKIPAWLSDNIITTYKETVPKGNKRTVKDYLFEHRCRNLIENIEDFTA
jgi:hypothetical protein